VRTEGGASDRRWLKVHCMTYLLTVCLNSSGNQTSPSDNLNNHC